MASMAFFSCIILINALINIITSITTPSAYSPNKKDRTEASKSIKIILSLSCSTIISKIVFCFVLSISFKPYFSNLIEASSSVKPSVLLFNSFITSTLLLV